MHSQGAKQEIETLHDENHFPSAGGELIGTSGEGRSWQVYNSFIFVFFETIHLCMTEAIRFMYVVDADENSLPGCELVFPSHLAPGEERRLQCFRPSP